MKIKRRTLALMIRLTIRVATVAMVTALFYGYFFTNVFTVTAYDISGVDDDAKVAIDTKLHSLDQQKAYKVFPRNKIFTYSNSMITNTVREQVPEMATVSMRPVGLHTVKIEVTLLKPLFRMSESQALTEDGTIFTTKYDIHTYPLLAVASSSTEGFKEDGLLFTRLILSSSDGYNEKKDKEFFIALQALTSKISSVIFPVATIFVESTGDISAVNASGTSKILFLKEHDYKKVWSTLVSAVDTEPLKSKLATNKAGLEYLDVRYGNKIFYRFNDMAFQNGTVTGILGNHATTTQGISTTTSPR